MASSEHFFSNFNESDYESYKVEYVGEKIECKRCFCFVSKGTCAINESITKNINPVAYINALKYIIKNPNEEEPNLKYLSTTRNKIYIINENCYISFYSKDGCTHEIVNKFFEMIDAQEIILLGSSGVNKIKDYNDKLPAIIEYSSGSNENTFKYPNKLIGIQAGIITYCDIKCIKYTYYHLIDKTKEFSAESFNLILDLLRTYINLSENEAENSFRIYSNSKISI